MQIIPSIFVQTESQFNDQYNAVKNSVDTIQLDVADGKFVLNRSWADPKIIKKVCTTNLELHLMVQKPLDELQRWIGIKNIVRVMVHYQTIANLESAISTISNINPNLELSIVFSPYTHFSVIEDYTVKVKNVMFMGVYPGYQGQKLITESLKQIKDLKIINPNLFVELDGGVNEQTLPQILESGVDAVCPGSAIFGNERTPEENVRRMREIIKNFNKIEKVV